MKTIAKANKSVKVMPWQTTPLAGGCVGSWAEDPGSGRWLWSVRWPAHRCLGDKCEIPPRPQLFRHGTAASERAARDAIAMAHSEGPPPRFSDRPQYVKA